MGNFFKEFREFISKGNALDLAVGLIIGTAFNAIIKSLVADIITPLISLLFKADLRSLKVLLKGDVVGVDPVTGVDIYSEGTIWLTYGNFFQAVIDFLIIALAIFLALKVITKLGNKLKNVKDAIAPNKEKAE